MKKNMVYLATGIVFFIFAVCIAYVFTEPTKSQEQQEAALQEQDASRLNTQDTEKAMPSADSLVFNAQNNTAQITTPPAEENTEEENIQKTAETAANPETPPALAEQTQKNDGKPSPAAPASGEKHLKEPKQTVQDKLPVPFIADSLKTRTVLEPKKNANTIVYTELMMDGNRVGLVFEGDKPIKPKTFRLGNPDRVVVDIEGYWILKLPQLISNRMVKNIRSSAQRDKTRIVFDLKTPVSSSLLYRIHSRKYQLVFK
ncbi:AMIN domain-containing protein [Taurinivorans muris]|uniref:AMIN domain-containing protein n=1 Tax=Taurinivorans muris TaxID=2787751 RepID=A0ABY5Y2P4_9BACT|nr:AMIN domain-containing protein [Desulfovibrionaceae bacterium LT0009]